MKKYILSFLVIISLFMLCVAALPAEVLADTATVDYLDENGVEQTITATEITSGTDTLNGITTGGWYVVNSDATRTQAITVTGDVQLILADGRTLTITSTSYNPGISVTGTDRMTVYGQTWGTGVLNAAGSDASAGIGGVDGGDGGTITINGGTVTVTGGEYGAGIGGGTGGSDGIVSLTGGVVSATPLFTRS